MAALYNQRNPLIATVSVLARTGDVIITTSPIVNMVGDRFILEFDQSVPYGISLPTTLNDTRSSYNVYDRYGNFVRCDRIYQAMQFREMGILPYSGQNVRQFQCVLGEDPGRINILCCLPRTNYVPIAGATTSSSISTVENTGITTSSAQTTVITNDQKENS